MSLHLLDQAWVAFSANWQAASCALFIGCLEWLLAMRRTLAVARLEAGLACGISFAENMLAFCVFSMFIRDQNWWVATAYSAGAAGGTWWVVWRAARRARA